MGWETYWLVTLEYRDFRRLPGLGPTRQVTVDTVAELRGVIESVRADAAVVAFQYQRQVRLDTADAPTICPACGRSLDGPNFARATPGWMACRSCPGHATWACPCGTTTVYPPLLYDCDPPAADPGR